MTFRPATALALVGLALGLTACSAAGFQTMLVPTGEQARDIDVIWRVMLAVCGVMYVIVLAFLAWALWRARRRGKLDQTPMPPKTAADPALTRTLTGWTALIAAGLVLLTTVSFLVDRSLAEIGQAPLQIKVTANQWWWQVEYQGDQPSQHVVTANELHLPVGRPAVITLQANDVIHSFWVPNLSGKTDLIPGRINRMPVKAMKAGYYRGQCAEFCGLEHAKMAFDVVVEEPAKFEAWRQRQLGGAAPPAALDAIAGQQVFNSKACVMCHRIQGTDAGGTVGPDLTHLKSRQHIAAGTLPNTRGDLQAWVADPQSVKPGTTMPRVPMSSDELNKVVAYLETLQ